MMKSIHDTPPEAHIRFMQEALTEAKKALEAEEVPIGCVVVYDGKIIARAYNLTERLNDPTAHAEMQAITMATHHFGGKYIERCIVYVTIEPCPMCAGALNWAQVAGVVFGASDIKRGFSLFSPSLLHPKTEILSGVLEDECSGLMREFFRKRRPDNTE